ARCGVRHGGGVVWRWRHDAAHGAGQVGRMAEFGLLFRDAQVVDSTARPPFHADVAVEGDRIVEVGRLDGATARREIPAVGRVLYPGFIDVHSHSDLPLLAEP